MDIKRFKKPAIILGSIIISFYALFLILPLVISPIVNSYGNYFSKVIEESTGFKVNFKNLRLVTTPKLTVGVKAQHISASLPNNDEILSGDNIKATVALIPIIRGKVQLDFIGADNLKTNLKIQPDGKFLLEKYIPQAEAEQKEETQAPMTGLPMGLRLSNRLPNITLKNYSIVFNDMRDNKDYSINGEIFKISDFVLNKKIKLKVRGNAVFDGDEQFKYNVRVLNKIMPDVELNDLVFNPAPQEETPQGINFNIADIFRAIHKNQISSNVFADIKTYGDFDNINIDGLVDVQNMTIAVNGEKLPEGFLKLDMSGKKIILNSELFTQKDEMTKLTGDIRNGKNPSIQLDVKSNAQINNIFKIVNSVAKSFNYKDLETLTATGAIDADFRFKTDMKKITSDGYFKIPKSTINYALYNILINNINADIDFSNDMADIKNFGFTIFSQPLKLYGTIKPDTTADLHLTADKLLLKGILTATGQLAILKDNNIKSGSISMDASAVGKLKEIKPSVDLNIDNVDVFNKPSDTGVKLKNLNVKIEEKDNSYLGTALVNSVNIINPMAKIALPESKITVNSKDIDISDSYLLFNNSRIDISGKISDYATQKLGILLKAKGNILASDIKNLIPKELRGDISAKGKLPLIVILTGDTKAQNIDFQLMANPDNYISILDVDRLKNRSTLINAGVKLENNSLKLNNTGLFTLSGSRTLSDNVSNNLSGAENLVAIKGAVDRVMTSPQLNNIDIKSSEVLSASIPGFKNSKAKAQFDIALNGNIANPSMKGFANIPSVELPTMKTTVKNTSVDINNKSIVIDIPTINIDNSVMNAKTVVSTNFANGIIINSVDFNSSMLDSDTLIKALANMPAQSTGSATSSTGNQNLGIIIQSGKGTISKFKSGEIIATDLSGNFNLKNNTFYLNNLQGNAYNGKIKGDISVNIINGKTYVDFHGNGMNATNTIASAAGIKNALSGTLGFNAKLGLNAYAPNETAMMKSINGDVDFSVNDGAFGNIGRIENLLGAENIKANPILNAVITPLSGLTVVKNSANFKYIKGDLKLNNGWANLGSIKTSGPAMAYYVTGKYNILNGTANLVILGRLGADVVAALGPLGDLSVSKLTSYIPKFGTLTGNLINAMTSNPNVEKISEIPELSNGSKNYKDFKVIFNGGIESKSSVKSFKWLSLCDTSAIETKSVKEQLQTSQQNLQQLKKEQIEDVKKSVENVKNSAKQTSDNIKNQIQNTKDSVNELKKLLKF